jgi:hypothetical protein
MNWDAFWSGLLGTTIPATLASVLMLYLNHRTNRSIEEYKSASARDLSDHKLWHEKRIASLLAIHDAFRQCLDWLRRSLYVSPPKGLDVTPLHDFFNSIQEHLVYLNDDLRETILKYQGELLQFWNWTVTLRPDEDPEVWKQVQKRLDFEIPQYLEKLRQDINAYADPKYPKGILRDSVKGKRT